MNTEENCEATFSVFVEMQIFFLCFLTPTCFFGLIAQCKIKLFYKCIKFIFLCHTCRLLHLAIIHEEDFITEQLIQLFPKEVLDIQNNLYQVNATGLFPLHRPSAASAGIFQSKWLPHYQYLDCGNSGIIYNSSSKEPLFLFICSPSSVRDVTVGGSRVSS